jgi:hypothetical protein
VDLAHRIFLLSAGAGDGVDEGGHCSIGYVWW